MSQVANMTTTDRGIRFTFARRSVEFRVGFYPFNCGIEVMGEPRCQQNLSEAFYSAINKALIANGREALGVGILQMSDVVHDDSIIQKLATHPDSPWTQSDIVRNPNSSNNIVCYEIALHP